MNKRILAPPSIAAVALTILAMVFLVLAPSPESSVVATTSTAQASEKLGPPAPSTMRLAAPAVAPTFERKFAPGDYVHLANCQSALTGANGDNDIAGYLSANNYQGWGWSTPSHARLSNTRVVAYFDVYRNGVFDGGRAAYCMGDDSNIVDKAGSSPAGW